MISAAILNGIGHCENPISLCGIITNTTEVALLDARELKYGER